MSVRSIRQTSMFRAMRETLERIATPDGDGPANEEVPKRPHMVGDCRPDVAGALRPCPYVGCKFNLYLDVLPSGSIRLNFPEVDPGEMVESCALDVAARGGVTLERVGELMNLTRERIRQVEFAANQRMRKAMEVLESGASEWDLVVQAARLRRRRPGRPPRRDTPIMGTPGVVPEEDDQAANDEDREEEGDHGPLAAGAGDSSTGA